MFCTVPSEYEFCVYQGPAIEQNLEYEHYLACCFSALLNTLLPNDILRTFLKYRNHLRNIWVDASSVDMEYFKPLLRALTAAEKSN